MRFTEHICFVNETSLQDADVPAAVPHYPARLADTVTPPLPADGRTNGQGQDISPIKNLPIRQPGGPRPVRRRRLDTVPRLQILLNRRSPTLDDYGAFGPRPAATAASTASGRPLVQLDGNKCNRHF